MERWKGGKVEKWKGGKVEKLQPVVPLSLEGRGDRGEGEIITR